MFAVQKKVRSNMAKIKRMDQVKIILKTYQTTGSFKATARRLQMSKNTVKHYVRLVQRANYSITEALDLDDKALQKLLYQSPSSSINTERSVVFNEQVDYWIKELRRVGVTRHLLWEEYRQDYPGGYGYTQFCEHLNRAIGRRDLTMRLQHKPGEKLQVDFAGKPMHWVDIHTAEVHVCQVLVGVLAHSQYTFAIALASQKVADFIRGLNQILLFFGKLPKVILSDNLKSFVTKANRYDPTFNEVCVQLAAHYAIDLEAARVGKPRDKAKVENMVGIAYNRIYAPLRNETFFSLEELNRAIRDQVTLHNDKPFQKQSGSRRSHFEDFEHPVMEDLPAQLFEVKKSVRAKVQRNYHVYLGEERNYYSVPCRYVGQTATVVYTSKIVEIFIDHQRVATHSRLPGRQTNIYQTDPDHPPKNHQEWHKSQGYDAAYFIRQAQAIGPATCWAIESILVSKKHEAQTYKACQGALRLAKDYSSERLEAACLRCQPAGKATYGMLKRILEHQLDQLPLQLDLFSTPDHDNIRGPQAYQ